MLVLWNLVVVAQVVAKTFRFPCEVTRGVILETT